MTEARSPVYWFFAKSRAFLVRDLYFETSYKLQSLFRLLSILFQVLTFYFLATLIGGEATSKHLEAYGGDYFTFALVGLSFSGLFNAGLRAFTTSIRQQMTMGVFEAMVASPIGSMSLLLYSLLWPLGFELLKALMYLCIGAAFLGADIALVRLPLLAAALALSLLVFGSLGIIAGSLILYFKRGDPIAWFLSSATQLVGGVLFPVTVLPGWLQSVAYVIPVPYALDALRGSLIPSATLENVGGNLIALALFALFLMPLAWWTANTVIEKARMHGSLGQF